jgi:hypothetical protein
MGRRTAKMDALVSKATEGVGSFKPGETITGAMTGGTGKYESATGHAIFGFTRLARRP